MTYYGVVLLMSGYQADEESILKQYKAIVDKLETKYPTGTLWTLNRVKILRMSGDPEGAMATLQAGLAPDRTSVFLQADALLAFELAWVFLAQRRYVDAAKMFLHMTEINTWSHATYYFIAAGCHWSLGNLDQAQQLLEATPAQIDKRKIGNKDLPTEVFIKKKLAFWKAKHVRRTGSEKSWVESISISPAEEMAIFWNTHGRITSVVAQAHIGELLGISPPVTLPTYLTPASSLATTTITTTTTTTTTAATMSPDEPAPTDTTITRAPLDTPDELALRALLLGIMHRAVGHPAEARGFLRDAHARHAKIPSTGSTWIGGVALFELAVLELREAQRSDYEDEAEAEAEKDTNSPSVSSGSSEEGSGDAVGVGVGVGEDGKVSVYGANGHAATGVGSIIGGRKVMGIAETELRIRVNALALGEKAAATARVTVTVTAAQRERWVKVLKEAGSLLDSAVNLSGSEVDLSSRLESRIAMLRDEIGLKRELLGIGAGR
ncbi:hypothetical protein B0F90DRAFT_582157 [Multifurca ochricompacta]|uniref:Uncharacterized protein n=1 Tax=Multifurca ochricompacta TaxID=376703 RepID=A0AAD4QH76_9AGAM|nr:hypothetical protein B0F90DRAFT_582157 [Multifurca ochricompacta]